jgi:cell division protein FtsB
VISEDTRFRTNLRTAIAVLSFVIAAAVWGTIVYLDVQQLKEASREKGMQLDRMSESLNALRGQVERLSWKLDNITASRGHLAP